MAKKETKKEKKEVIKEVVENTKEEITKEPEGKETKGDVTKVKAKMKKESEIMEQTITKVDLSKVTETPKEEVVEEVIQETPVVEEITDEGEVEVEATQERIKEVVAEAKITGEPVPENIQKLMEFMENTGGDINDYVKLNQDYTEMDNHTILEEYYKQTKPHLTGEEINFLMEDSFSYDEEVDEDRDIKRKKLAQKEQVASARQHLDGLKSKYYEDIKGGSKLTSEQQEAINFYNEQKEIAQQGEGITNDFVNKTNRFFGDQFKGFEYNVGDKRFRYNVQDVDKVKDTQTDIDNFIGKFLDKDGKMTKESEYHKSLYTAMNADAIANHFYEQGKADAVKNSIAQSKNVDMKPRQELTEPHQDGPRIRVMNNDDSPEFKFKIKNKNN